MSSSKPTVLVSGGAGYIGSHAALALRDSGYSPLVLDNLSKGHRVVVEQDLGLPLIVGDTADRGFLDKLFVDHDIAAVMHFAAWTEVGESATMSVPPRVSSRQLVARESMPSSFPRQRPCMANPGPP